MKNRPLFTIIMANYNNGKYITEAIQSVFKQTYTNWELFIVDDGSTDNSREECQRFLVDPRVHLLINTKNKGIGYSKWLGAKESFGEIVAYFDADDVLEPNALGMMVDAHLAHPEWVLIGSKYRMLTGVNQLAPYPSPVGPSKGEPDDYLLCHPNRIVAFSSFKRNAYEQTEGFGNTLRCTEDKDIYLKLEEVGGENCIGFINAELYQYRQDNTNSLSLGSLSKHRYSQYYRAWVYLKAYERRYISQSFRYKRYKQEYASKMYEELVCMARNRQHFFEPKLLHYDWIYLNINGFNKKSIKRSLKLFFRIY